MKIPLLSLHLKSKLLVLFIIISCEMKSAFARDEWFRRLDLENAAVSANLVIAARVVDVSETHLILGGKAERPMQQFTFKPLRVLKGVFARAELSLTSDDLGTYRFGEAMAQIERGQVRLLFLGRSSVGYVSFNQAPHLDQSMPPLRDSNDPLLETVKVLLAIHDSHDRVKKLTLLLDRMHDAKGPSVIPLLASLERRALLAAQMPEAAATVTKYLSDASPAVREAAAKALKALLDADYLNQRDLREVAVAAVAASLERADADITARAVALDALGAAGATTLNNESATRQLQLNQPSETFVVRSARLRAIGQLKRAASGQDVLAFLEQLPLDAPQEIQRSAGLALVRVNPGQGLEQLTLRIENKFAAGLDAQVEISLLGELPADIAVPALLDVPKRSLNRMEKIVFAQACIQIADSRLVLPLAGLLDPRQQDVRWYAVEALLKINTDDAAKALQPHLREEANLLRKLQIAEFLGHHGIRDGYAYAIEHMSEPPLLEQSVAALAAIREPKAIAELRNILMNSNDIAWKGAVVRALGALGEKDLASQFLEIVQDLKNPLVPFALIALGDLGEAKALAKVREGLVSRNNEVVTASARAAGKLLAMPEVKADDVRDHLATLLADGGASQEPRAAALGSLVALQDARLDRVLAAAVRDAGLEGSELLELIEKLLRDRKLKLILP